MSKPVNCGTSFCSCIECVSPGREELMKAVEDARDAYDAAWDVKDASAATWDTYIAAKIALDAYDEENA